MSAIQIDQRHSLGTAEAKKRVEALEPRLRERYGLELEWRGDEAVFKGRGFSGTLRVTADRVAIELKLGLLARPFAGKIEAAMHEQVAKALA
jgi:putative polyhydroxyalkanoate system protein